MVQLAAVGGQILLQFLGGGEILQHLVGGSVLQPPYLVGVVILVFSHNRDTAPLDILVVEYCH